MAAAIEAMADMGFPKKLVRQKVNQLLKVGTFFIFFFLSFCFWKEIASGLCLTYEKGFNLCLRFIRKMAGV